MGSVFYEVVADATAVAHLIFILYVVCGGFLAWRWPRTIALHLAAVAWGFTGLLVGIDCPLTHLESWARVRAGQDPLPSSGFISHYLTGVVYPESAAGAIQTLVALGVVTSWVGYVVLRLRTPSHPPTPAVPASDLALPYRRVGSCHDRQRT